jgi:hypothetical protein
MSSLLPLILLCQRFTLVLYTTTHEAVEDLIASSRMYLNSVMFSIGLYILPQCGFLWVWVWVNPKNTVLITS